MMVDFCFLKDNFHWHCTTVYIPNSRAHKNDFWEEFRCCEDSSNVPWVICGDFNAIFTKKDKALGVPNLEDIRKANSLLQDLGLRDPPFVGKRFTWTNCQTDPFWV